MHTVANFFREEQGQDLTEYALLLAFVAMGSAALFIGTTDSMMGIWVATNSRVTAASAMASSS